MTYFGMPFGMWALFAPSFRKQLTAVLGYDTDTAKAITKKAKPKYSEIIADLPEFEKADRFKMNIVNCAMLDAFILSMPERPDVERLTEYYAKSMMTKPMKWFCRKSGKSKFTEKDIADMKATAALRAADRNPYSWNMELYEYPDGSGYEGRFTRRGIRLPPPCSLPQNRARGITGASRYAPTPMRKSQAKQIGLKPPSRKNRGRPSGLPVTTPNRAIPCFARPCPVTMWSPRGCTSAGLGCMKPH